MDTLLQPIDTTSALFIYRHNQKLISNDYETLSEVLSDSLFEGDTDHQLVVDWTYTPTHPLIFEFHLQEESEKNVFDFFMRFFDTVFLDVFRKHFPLLKATFLLTMDRNPSSGFCVHVLDHEVSHDDYIHLCEMMRVACEYEEENLSIFLTIPTSFPLPSCNRPHEEGPLYKPVRLVQAEFGFYQENGVWRTFRLENELLQQENKDSFFDEVANHEARWKEMARKMMPVPQSNAIYLHFPTQIHLQSKIGKSNIRCYSLAEFKSYADNNVYVVCKGNKLVQGKSFLYHFLKQNANQINLIHAFESLFMTWYARFRQINPFDFLEDKRYTPRIQDIDRELKKLCPHLRKEISPLGTVLAAHKLPVYYALSNIVKDMDTIEEYFPFLSSNPLPVRPTEAERLTLNTILYCGYRTGEGSMISHIIESYDWIIKTTENIEDLIRHVRWVQQRAFPIVQGSEKLFSWNSTTGKWIPLNDPALEITNILLDILEYMNTYSEIPSEFMNTFKEKNLAESVANDIMKEVYRQGIINGNSMTESSEVYGDLVPEYYFFE